MTQYIVDGDIGAMITTQEDPSANMTAGIDSVKRMNAEQTISLTLPTQLEFGELTWKLRFPDTFAGTFNDRNLKEQQPDAFLDGWTGYSRSGSWYAFNDTDNEWFEAHGGVGGAWWQFLFQGRNRALFTDGSFSKEVELTTGAWYYVAMVFGAGVVTVRLSDSDGTVLASNTQEGLTVSLSESYLGASAMVYNIVGDSDWVQFYRPVEDVSRPPMPLELSPIPDNEIYYDEKDDIYPYPSKRIYGEHVNRDGSSGYISWLEGLQVNVKTGQLGTHAGQQDYNWIRRPWWATCVGRLDYTFDTHVTTGPWYRLYCYSIPEKYDNSNGYLEWQPRLQPREKVLDDYPEILGAIGQSVGGFVSTVWPTGFEAGAASGIYTFPEIHEWRHVGPFYSPIEDYIREGAYFYLGLEVTPDSRAEFPPWWICGNGFQWPYRTGTGNSWRTYHTTPHDWLYRWVLSPQDGGNPSLEVDDIVFDADLDLETGDLITEDAQPMEGWNTEMGPVEDGTFSIEATPVRGSVNVYTVEGILLDYDKDWEEADDTGLNYILHKKGITAVTVTFFLTRPVLGNRPIISRPTQELANQQRPRHTRTSFL